MPVRFDDALGAWIARCDDCQAGGPAAETATAAREKAIASSAFMVCRNPSTVRRNAAWRLLCPACQPQPEPVEDLTP